MHEHTLALICVSVAFAVMGYIVLAAIFTKPFPECWYCGDPLVNGYDAIHEGRKVCRSCCRKRDITPWYVKRRT